MRKAVIDLGTNTFNLLIGELINDRLSIIHAERSPVLLGMGGINEGVIAEDAYKRGLIALEHFKKVALEHDVIDIKGFATSAVRGAINGQSFIQDAYDKFQIKITLISGPEEGLLIFKGVGMTYNFDKPSVIMDIGGGSTEFVLADHIGFKKISSLNIGVSRIYQQIGAPEDYTAEDIKRVYQFIKETAGHALDPMKCDVLVGSSGTFETFYEMIHEKPFESKDQALQLPFNDFMHILEWSIHSSYQERIDHPWVIDMRKKMLPVGAMKIKWVIEKLGIKEVWVSPYSLKEGAFIS